MEGGRGGEGEISREGVREGWREGGREGGRERVRGSGSQTREREMAEGRDRVVAVLEVEPPLIVIRGKVLGR